jgi:ATPase subunit of ABC transporter with duplicated ATPase domains
MITVSDLGLGFNGQNLFSHVNLLFAAGNCYGVIGANGAGKSTFLKLISGELEPTKGEVIIDPRLRMSVLKQDHHAYDSYTVFETILMGNPRLYEVLQQKDKLYAKEDFSDEDGILAADLEAEFAEMNGWEAETEAGRLLQGLGVSNTILYSVMNTLVGAEKVKVLLARALLGQPDIILLDEPTNDLDNKSIAWLEGFLMDYPGMVIVVSHDRHFLNNVCTHIVDIDYNKIKMYVGNYDFWYESSQIVQRIMHDQNKKAEDKIKELQNFIQRFSANKSKSKQATSRKKLLDKITVDEMPASSRRYPFVGSNEIANTTLFQILMEEIEPDEGTFKWGVSTSQSYFPQDNSTFFNECELSIIKWLEQYSKDTTETYLRGFLGKMLFSGDDVTKPVNVLSGGEKVRCMLSRMMMFGANVLLADQPTNHLDLESITAVNNGLIDFKGIVLFASHDHQFVQSIANRIIEITEDGVVDRISTYDDYLEARDGIIS